MPSVLSAAAVGTAAPVAHSKVSVFRCMIHINFFAQYFNRISAEHSVHQRDVWKDISASPQ